MPDRMITFTGIAKNCSDIVFSLRTNRLPILGYVCFICSSAFSFQQNLSSKEMSASIRTYWPRSQYTLKADSNLVEVGVVVRDTRGRAIGGFTKDDFVIEDAGKHREITTFSVEMSVPMTTPPPAANAKDSTPESPRSVLPWRYVALLFDDFSMAFADQFNVKAAARRFLKEGLAQGDRVGLFTTSGKQVVPFTDDVAKLVAVLDGYNSFPRTPDGGICPKLTPYDAYIIANKIDYETFAIKDAEYLQCTKPRRQTQASIPRGQTGPWPPPGTNPVMVQAENMWIQIRDTSARALETTGRLVDYMAQLPGRKMVLLASSGFLAATLEAEYQKVINHALHAVVVINTLDAKGLYAEDAPDVTRVGANEFSIRRLVELGTKPKDLNKDVMSVLAGSTGGLFFENNNDLDLGFRKLGMMPEVSYLLGFLPHEAPDGKYHGLKVRLKSKNDYMIQARPGYWAVTKKQLEPLDRERKVDRQVMGADTLGELPAVIGSEPAKTNSGEPALEVVITIDARKFHFVEKEGLRTQNLLFIATLFDEKGDFVTGTELQVKFALRESTYTRFTETGIEMSVLLQAPPGTYRLRGVAQDGIEGKIVASSFPVQIR